MSWSNVLPKQYLSQLESILANAKSDFTTNLNGYLSASHLEEVLTRAHTELFNQLQSKKIHSADELAAVWNHIVVDFHTKDHWGYPLLDAPEEKVKIQTPQTQLASYIRAFIVPTLLLKAFVLYFGLNYSSHPGEGYGWGLIISITLSLFNFALFLWKTRNNQET